MLEISEVILLVQLILEHDITEEVQSQCCKDENEDYHQTHDIGYLW